MMKETSTTVAEYKPLRVFGAHFCYHAPLFRHYLPDLFVIQELLPSISDPKFIEIGSPNLLIQPYKESPPLHYIVVVFSSFFIFIAYFTWRGLA